MVTKIVAQVGCIANAFRATRQFLRSFGVGSGALAFTCQLQITQYATRYAHH
jgi:hypothetical protein